MTMVLDGTRKIRHPEERQRRVSKDAKALIQFSGVDCLAAQFAGQTSS
jgi:hypothetical protein